MAKKIILNFILMKKLYSLFAVAVLSASAYSQTQTTVLTEDFAAYTKGGNTTSSGTTAPDGTDIYNPGTTVLPAGVPSANFPTGTKAYMAGGMVKLGTSSLAGSMTSKVVDLSTDGGNVIVSFDVKGWTSVEGDIKVTITGQASKTVSYTALMSGSLESKSVSFTGGVANSTVKIETTAKRAYIDNIKVVTTDTSLAVVDANSSKARLVKNTVVDSNIIFAAKADVKVINANGQVVKTASVNENTTLDVASLAKGMYIVTGTVNGQAVSQKIIKK